MLELASMAATEEAATDQQRDALLARYQAVRSQTLTLTEGLSAEDMCVQAMPDASPCKWHLAHTTWFFEVVVLRALNANYISFDERWWGLFNSYYNSLGAVYPRAKRGLLTRPDLNAVREYRRHVDQAMAQLLQHHPAHAWRNLAWLTELGLAHEAQHQELILTDLLYLFSANPLLPSVCAHTDAQPPRAQSELAWIEVPGGVHEVGQDHAGFAFDHERPRHAVILPPMAMANRPVTNAEFQAFMDDGGYSRPELWSSAGWEAVCAQGWRAPLYWLERGQAFSLHGPRPLDPHAPVSHVSLHEAMAFAAWSEARLPTESEWEVWQHLSGDDLEASEVWEWTSSAFAPYPGYRPWTGALAEYNGKFMVEQTILRGASIATPRWTRRITCRNFFHSDARWQFSGLRLARDK